MELAGVVKDVGSRKVRNTPFRPEYISHVLLVRLVHEPILTHVEVTLHVWSTLL